VALLGWFDGELRADAWFDAELQPAAWFDTEIVDTSTGSASGYTLTAQGGSYALTGQSAILQRSKRITASGGAYALAGQSALLARNRKLTANGGSYALAGQQVTITYTAGAVGYTLTAQGGSYSLAGQSATLARNRTLSASGGSYSLTGQSAKLYRNRKLTAQGGAYTYTGPSRSPTHRSTPTRPTSPWASSTARGASTPAPRSGAVARFGYAVASVRDLNPAQYTERHRRPAWHQSLKFVTWP
jgi:hypothetical protein